MAGARAAVGVALLLVLAGCSGGQPTGSSQAPETTGTSTGSEAASTSAGTPGTAANESDYVEGVVVVGDLPTNATRVYERVVSITGQRPTNLTVYTQETFGSGGSSRDDETFLTTMGVERPANYSITLKGYYEDEKVFVRTGGMSEEAVEATLAHEYAHALQFEDDAYTENVAVGLRENATGNEVQVIGAVTEGAAVYVEAAYTDAYMDVGQENGLTSTSPAEYRNLSAYEKAVLFPYVRGYEYVRENVDSPEELDEVYEDPPRTTEELIHDLEPGSEPPTDLSLSVDPGDAGSMDAPWTLGEFGVRVVLDAGVDWNRSTRAGTGWGNDTLQPVRVRGESAYVWATRWDSVDDADEFETAMRASLDARANRSSSGGWRDDGDAFRLVRGSDDVVVLVSGEAGFVANATVDVDGADVAVTPRANASNATSAVGTRAVGSSATATSEGCIVE